MNYAPFDYNQINLEAGTYSPNTVKTYNNESFLFWERALFQRALSVLDFKNLPFSGAVRDYFLFVLFSRGFLCFFDIPETGLAFQPCSLSGFDLYYQPVRALVSNPLLSREFTIGSDCELLKLTPDYRGIIDCISYFASKLAQADVSIDMSLINSRLAWIIGAKNKSSSRAIKQIIDSINKGNPAAVYDNGLLSPDNPKEEPWVLWDRHVKESYITTDLLRDAQTILNSFDTEIGIPTIPYEKKERMVTSEAESKQLDSISRSTVWMETLKDSLKKVNEHFGLNIEVSHRYLDAFQNVREESEADGKADTV